MCRATAAAASAISRRASRTSTAWRRRSWPPYVSLSFPPWLLVSFVSLRRLLTNSKDGVLALSGISLAIKVPRMSDPKTQGVAIVAWGSVLFLVYSLLLSVFRGKNAGYPFSLPPFM